MNLRSIFLAALSAGVLYPLGSLKAQPTASLQLKPGEHIAIIGNALPDRMQHYGHFETLLHARFPNHQLTVRNLAVAGDEVAVRHRSENFGTPDDWLKKTQADVILAFFGFNESFKGYAGIEKFRADLERFLKATLAQNYSGRGAPRVVLISPIANEKHLDPNFPDPMANNANLADYTAAMADVARANGVPFVDLLKPSRGMLAGRRNRSLTVNGIYLNEEGDKALAPILYRALFNEAPPSANLEKLRAAVNEKNAQWHGRYRTVDGYNVYGGRSKLSYESGKGGPKISNYQVMQEEMSQRDVLTANRDQRVWAMAKGKELKVDDSNLPPLTEVKSNKPGENPDLSHKFLSGEAAIGKMTAHSGTRINLFASEEQFPELIKPVQMAWDTKGRLWVAAWRNYPERTPTSKIGDSLLIFEDTNHDGKADKCIHFLDDLNAPTGFQFYRDGVLLMQAPDFWFVRDTNGDDKADTKERILMGMDSADSHHTANAICLDPGGAVYLSDGVFHRTQVETAYGPVRNNDAAIFRFEPRTGKFETYVSYGFANPHGRVFDYWGNDIITDATGNENFFGPAFSGFLDYPAKHPALRQFWARPSRPCAGTGLVTSRHFPAEFQGNFLNANVISFQGIYRVKVSEEGSGLKGESLEELVSSTDPNFRPTAVSVGSDGAIYFCDWQNPIIGHMQHHLRDPSRDHEHGRIYRMTYTGRPLMTWPKISGASIPALVDLLKEPENQIRELAKVELGARDTAKVLAAVEKWAAALDKKDAAFEHHLMEALWVHQWHNVVNMELLGKMLRSPEANARAAATRVLCYWRDRVPNAMPLLKRQAEDESPRVRLEAIRAASFFRVAEAADIALAALKYPTDYYIDYTLKETLRQLEPWWRKAINDGHPIASDNPAGIDHLIRSVSTAELLKLPRTPGVLTAILNRSDVLDATRAEVLDALAKERKTTRLTELLSALEKPSTSEAGANLARLLPMQPSADLAKAREQIARKTNPSAAGEARPAAWAALALADDRFDRVWADASTSPARLSELLNGIPLIPDPDFRNRAYDKVHPLLSGSGIPAELQAAANNQKGSSGRYVRLALPRRGTLTLAEVQVFSGGQNVAPKGRATQSSVSNSGDASRAVDGRTDGSYASGTQTHTQENDRQPWWELDLGTEQPIEGVAVWNRIDGDLGRRLDGYVLTILDGNRREIFRKADNPAPAPTSRHDVGVGDPLAGLRRSAIRAVVSMTRDQDKTFAELTQCIARKEEVPAAAQGLRVLPRGSWPKAAAGSAATALVAWAKTVPSEARTGQEFIEAVQFAGDLAGYLPTAEAAAVRKELREMSVPIFVLRTVREQMRYDTPRLVVEAGKALEIILENDDFMPHNLAVVRPGTREKVANLAAVMKPDEVDARGRAYIPNSTDVVSATRLLEPGQKVRLSLTAPNEPGVYEYVCTYPGHWMIMWGQLIVTKDVDAYLAENPAATLPASGSAPEHDHHK